MNHAASEIALERLLGALEFGSRKEDMAFTDRVLNSLGLERRRKSRLIADIMAGPGFEPFFLAVAREAQPFARMLRGVYAFLSQHRVTSGRRADVFRVSADGARSAFDFDLEAFPKTIERTLREVETGSEFLRLNLPSDARATAPSVPAYDSAAELWHYAAPRWDGDFYDDGFFRALSYAGRLLAGAPPDLSARAAAAVEPIMLQLRALTEPLEWPDFGPPDLQFSSYMNGPHERLTARLYPREQVHLDHLHARAYFILPFLPEIADRESIQEVGLWSAVEWTARSFALAVHLWETRYVRSTDRDDWLSRRLRTPFSSVSALQYVDGLLEPLAREYRLKLDGLVRVHREPRQQLREALLEFFGLPFWKDRWFLYELWTLCYTLSLAQSRWPVALHGLRHRADGVTDWELPGGLAGAPVATIGGAMDLECWTQRKTFHPLTGAGLEPDLRITRSSADHADVFIAENKDRRKPRKSDIREILERYVTGTAARCVCLLNYEMFTGPTHALGAAVPGREVLIVSNFRPIRPAHGDFEERLLHALESELGADDPNLPAAATLRSARPDLVTIRLRWQREPHDLDLHAWIERAGDMHHVCFSARGTLGEGACALLSADARQAPGEEILQVKTEGLMRAVIGVHRFVPGAFCDAGASVEILGNTTIPVRLDQVALGNAEWWHVAEIDGQDLSIRVFNQLIAEPPVTA